MKTIAEMIAVMQYYEVHGLGSVEFSKTDVWVCAEPFWDWKYYTYRITKTPDTIDWSHIHPCYQWMARNDTDKAYLFCIKPEIAKRFGWYSKSGEIITTSSHVSYKQGTCDWKDSLVHRFNDPSLIHVNTIATNFTQEKRTKSMISETNGLTSTPIDGHDEKLLLAHAKRLKQTDGEGWAIGELVEQIIASYHCGETTSPIEVPPTNSQFDYI